jgi:hypothetical protein
MKQGRVQTGIRIDRRLLKVLKGLAEYKEMRLGELVEGVLRIALDNRTAFTPETLAKVQQLRALYEADAAGPARGEALRCAPPAPPTSVRRIHGQR